MGDAVGTNDVGAGVGSAVGAALGTAVGFAVGAAVGLAVGLLVGLSEGGELFAACRAASGVSPSFFIWPIISVE